MERRREADPRRTLVIVADAQVWSLIGLLAAIAFTNLLETRRTNDRMREGFDSVRREIGEMRGDFGQLRGQFGELRGGFGELRGEFAALRAEVRADIAQLRTDLSWHVGGHDHRPSA